MRGWTVIGGWALSPEVLHPVFGTEGITYVDLNGLAPRLVGENGTLRADWRSRAREAVAGLLGEGSPGNLAGWSTGAMVAVSIAADLGVRRLVLLSAAGALRWPARVLRGMRQRLAADRAGVVRDFLRRCGGTGEERPSSVPDGALAAGLIFLEHYCWGEGKLPLEGRVTVFHGRDDRVVPPGAGRDFARRIGAEFVEHPGGHLFFRDPGNARAIRECL